MGGLTTSWEDLRLQTIEAFDGQTPRPELEQELEAAYDRAPHAVNRAIERVHQEYADGTARSPWGLLRSRVKTLTDEAPKRQKLNDRQKLVERAEQWIRATGIHYDRASEVLDDLFGDRGLLEHHQDDALKHTLVELWRQQRPRGERVETEELERAQAWRTHHPEYVAKHIPQELVLDVPAISLGAGDTPLPPHLVRTDNELVDAMFAATTPVAPGRFADNPEVLDDPDFPQQ